MLRIFALLALGLSAAGCSSSYASYRPLSTTQPASEPIVWNGCDYECRRQEVVRLSQANGCLNSPAMRSNDRELLMNVSHEDLVQAAKQNCKGVQLAQSQYTGAGSVNLPLHEPQLPTLYQPSRSVAVQAQVQVAHQYGRPRNRVVVRGGVRVASAGNGQINCKPGYKAMEIAGAMVCNKHSKLDGGHPKFDQRVEHCEPGTLRSVTVPGPNGTTIRANLRCTDKFSQESRHRQ